ncbi:MAG TPA: SH3 domain-containing protein [Mobilitalea sp.]|nr:SH3 domain-containing protein [Mobilitalea sp.]
MKKSIYLLIISILILLSGCSKKDQLTNFIPTQVPEEVTTSVEGTDENAQTDAETAVTPTPAAIHIGATTTKYVKLDEYGGYLNIRSKPSTDAEAVGFLVHAEEVKVIEIKDGWASILYNDAICYVNADFLVDERPAYLTPPPPTPTPIVTPTPVPGTAVAPPEI